MIIVIVIGCLFVGGYAVYLWTIHNAPNMKDYFDKK